jgi:hypothetical protein
VLTRTRDRSFEVQARFKQEQNGSSDSAAAMNVNGDKVSIYDLGGTVGLININGQEFPFTIGSNNNLETTPFYLPHGGQVFTKMPAPLSTNVYVIWPDGSSVVTLHHPNRMGTIGVHVPESQKGNLEGLLGNYDGNPTNDFRARDGTQYPENLTFEQRCLAIPQEPTPKPLPTAASPKVSL